MKEGRGKGGNGEGCAERGRVGRGSVRFSGSDLRQQDVYDTIPRSFFFKS